MLNKQDLHAIAGGVPVNEKRLMDMAAALFVALEMLEAGVVINNTVLTDILTTFNIEVTSSLAMRRKILEALESID